VYWINRDDVVVDRRIFPQFRISMRQLSLILCLYYDSSKRIFWFMRMMSKSTDIAPGMEFIYSLNGGQNLTFKPDGMGGGESNVCKLFTK
jgi:hypothetical protein